MQCSAWPVLTRRFVAVGRITERSFCAAHHRAALCAIAGYRREMPAPCFALPTTSQIVESTSIVNAPGVVPAAHAR